MDLGQALAAAAAALVVGLYPQARAWEVAVKMTPEAEISISACRAHNAEAESTPPSPAAISYAAVPDAFILTHARSLR
ncbi:MAG TPA: hypothetical protein PKY87_13215 [Terricaulis sp.]|nr:hypothetical protein [Terricaulis sp.]